MKYAVQYAYTDWLDTHIPVDTNPISYEEAVALFNEYKDDFVNKLKEDKRPQLCIWEDVGDGEFPIYGKALMDLDYRDELEYSNGRFYKTVRQEIELPAPTAVRGLNKEDN